MGYYRAGFDVVGVDKEPQPNYPFPFYQCDALHFLRTWWTWRLPGERRYDIVHASPPCQHYTTLAKGNNDNRGDYPDLIPPTRKLLDATGLPYVIENVPSAPLLDSITLCGEMFGLSVIRHRKFESNLPLVAPAHVKHRGRVAGMRHGTWYEGPYFAVYGEGGGKGTVPQWQQAMGIDWTDNRKSIAEAIPPAYTEFVGKQLLAASAQRSA